MVIILGLRWWYSAGWVWAWKRAVIERVAWCFNFFSVPELGKTLFSPFKQTYSKSRRSTIDAKIQTAVDNFVSRVIGSLARSVLIFCGLFCALLAFMSGVLFILAWAFIPAIPVIGVLLTLGIAS